MSFENDKSPRKQNQALVFAPGLGPLTDPDSLGSGRREWTETSCWGCDRMRWMRSGCFSTTKSPNLKQNLSCSQKTDPKWSSGEHPMLAFKVVYSSVLGYIHMVLGGLDPIWPHFPRISEIKHAKKQFLALNGFWQRLNIKKKNPNKSKKYINPYFFQENKQSIQFLKNK